MPYRDVIYGEYSLPDFIEALVHTPEVQRLRNLSMDCFPKGIMPWKMHNRLEHSTATAHLGERVVSNNKNLARQEALILASALLHDTGNPPFSHLSEQFLRQLTGKDGESNLETILSGSKAEGVLSRLGITAHQVVRFVTGNHLPLSRVLNGTLDIDNTDNIVRYWFAVNKEIRFDPVQLASAFRFDSGRWSLRLEALGGARSWQTTREEVYGIIYGAPHLSAQAMLCRAIALALKLGEIQADFFRLEDAQALDFLVQCNAGSQHLVRRILGRDFYEEVVSIETTEPSIRLISLAENSAGEAASQELADHIAEHMGTRQAAICTYIGKGVDRRKIDLPFLDERGGEYRDNGNHFPIYRLKVYIDQELKPRQHEIAKVVKENVL